MRWDDERYVRMYTRDTPETLALPWQARALWWEMLRKFDRAGIIDIGRAGVHGLAKLVDMPVEVVSEMLPKLLDDGRLRQVGTELIAPNYVDAQETPQTDAARRRASRERARARLKSDATTRPSEEPVTSGHVASRPVTPIRTVPSRTVPDCAVPDPDARAHEAGDDGSPEVADIVAELTRHPSLAPIASLEVAEMLEGRRMACGKPLAHVLAAIGELGADACPGWTEETLRRKVRTYCDRAGPRAGPRFGPRRGVQPVPADGDRAWTPTEVWDV